MAASGSKASQVKPSTRLRQLLAEPGCLQAPGVYDGMSARLAIEAGFKVLYQSGAVVTASKLGLPDFAFASMRDYTETGSMIANIDASIPLVADADTGFGGPNNIARTVREYDRVGIAAFHIEDQVQMKRIGHLAGKQIIDMESWKSNLRAAVQARADIPGGSDIVIIARTDALSVEGLDSAIERMKVAKEIGIDVAFVEGMSGQEQIKTIVKALAPMPTMSNQLPNSKIPPASVSELSEWGVKLVIYPLVSALPAIEGMRKGYRSLIDTGSEKNIESGITPIGFFEVMGLDREVAIDKAVGGL